MTAQEMRIYAYRQELVQLEQSLQNTIAEVEILTRVKYTQWKLDHKLEQLYWLRDGVVFPRTQLQQNKDRLFLALERQLEEKRIAFEYKARQIEEQDRYRIEEQRRQELAHIEYQSAERQRAERQAIDRAAAEDQRAAEQARIAAGREAAALIAKALGNDME